MAVRSMLYVAAFSIFLIVLEKVDLSAFAYETPNGTSKILGPLVAGLINGVTADTLSPAGNATRAQAAKILMMFCQNVAK